MTQVDVPCEWQFQTSSPNVDMIMTKDNYKITRQTSNYLSCLTCITI